MKSLDMASKCVSLLCIFFILFLLHFSFIHAASRPVRESSVILPPDYNKDEPPSIDPTEVKLALYILKGSIDDKDMSMTLVLYLRQRWKEPRIQAIRRSKERRIRIFPDDRTGKYPVWTPDTFVRNAVDTKTHESNDNEVTSIFFNTTDNSLFLVEKTTLKLDCPLRLHRFPFDTQTCSITVESFGYKADVMYFANMSLPVDLDSSVSFGNFHLLSWKVIDCTQNYTSGSYPCWSIAMTLVRQNGFYIKSAFLPSAFLVAISWIGPWVAPSQTATRVLLPLFTSAGVLAINYRVMDSIAPGLAYFTAYDCWTMACMILITLTLVEYLVVSCLSRSKCCGYEPLDTADGYNKEGPHMEGKSVDNKFLWLDVISRITFPVLFLIFVIIYFPIYA